MKNLIILVALVLLPSLSSQVLASDTIKTMIVVQGSNELDLVKQVEANPTIIRAFSHYSEVKWFASIEADSPCILDGKPIKRVRIIRVTIVCNGYLETTNP